MDNETATRIYGASDDLIEIEGGKASGEVGCYGTDEQDRGVLVICSDGTLLEVKYGKDGAGIWEVKCLQKGSYFDRIDVCTDEESDMYSDVAHFTDPLDWAYAASEWKKVR